jgi:hypothetical protein
MAKPVEKIEPGLEVVYERLGELEKRIEALEKREVASANPSVGNILGAIPKDKEKKAGGTSAVPVIGRAVLAIAGAYLLRAVAESGAAPRWVMLVAGIVYAGLWVVWAARSHGRSHFASEIYALSAAAILAPLLWEGTVRFGALTAGFAAAVLVGYVGLSLGLAWKEKLEVIPWMAVVAAVGTALGLVVATHELRALTVGLLAMALLVEVATWSGRWEGLRIITALGILFAMSVIGVVMTARDGVPESYRAMGAREVGAFCVAMMVIYGASMAVRGFGFGKEWTISEIAQAVAAIGLGTWVSLRATPGGARILGVAFLGMAAVCYWGALKRFANAETSWDRRVSANFAAGLTLAGSWLLLNGPWQVLLLSAAAVAAVLVFRRTGYLSLGIHGTFYLLAAGVGCGLFGYSWRAMAGTVPGWPEWGFGVAGVAALISYVAGSRVPGTEWRTRVLWVVPAAVVGSALAGVVVAGIAGMGAGELSASRLSMVRTVVTCVMALGLGYVGSRWNRVELGWVAYGAIALGALKLLVEDLRFGNAGTLVVSLLSYGLILILLPRLTRFGRVEV